MFNAYEESGSKSIAIANGLGKVLTIHKARSMSPFYAKHLYFNSL